MKTHMSNTKALELATDIVAKNAFMKHQSVIHTNVKPLVVTKRKEQIKIVNNNKKQINQNPKQHVNQLFKNLHSKGYKCSLDNQAKHYEADKKILKDKIKKNKQENYAKSEHQRELRSQKSRVQNCKNITQRKKDKTDPIVNPTYLMRDGSNLDAATIDQYCKKVVQKNRPSSAIPGNAGKVNCNLGSTSIQFSKENNEFDSNMNFGNVPNLTKNINQRTSSAKYPSHPPKQAHKKSDDLPGCTFKQILNHIVDRKMFKDSDMKVLYVRLCHKYSQNEVDDIWETLMDELQK